MYLDSDKSNWNDYKLWLQLFFRDFANQNIYIQVNVVINVHIYIFLPVLCFFLLLMHLESFNGKSFAYV